MNLKILIPIVAMISVFVMFIWGFAEGTWNHCWLAIMAGGIAIVILSMLSKGNKKDKE